MSIKYLEVSSYHNNQIVSTADLKTHLRITFSDDDDYLVALEGAAVRMVEEYTNLYLNRTTVIQYATNFSGLTILFKSPASDEDHTLKYQTGSAWVTVDTSDYEFVNLIKPPRVYAGESWSVPSTDDVFQAWKFTYLAGYASTGDIPEALIQAIKIIVADMYENRQSVIVGKIVSEIPKTATYLMNPYKIQTL